MQRAIRLRLILLVHTLADTSPPVPTLLTNDAPDAGFLKIGDSITFNLSMQSDEPGLQVSATYNSEDIHFNYKLGSLGSYYQATYTIDESHAPYNGTTPPLIVSSFFDRAGNEGSLSVLNNVKSNVNTGFDNILPSINSISITTAVTKTLILSDSIEFIILADDSGTNPSSPFVNWNFQLGEF